MSKLAQESAVAAYKNKCLFRRPISLSLRVSLTLGMAGGRGSPRRATCRMSVYFTDTGMNACELSAAVVNFDVETGIPNMLDVETNNRKRPCRQ